MNRIKHLALLALGLALAGTAPASAQSGFALKGGLVFNSSETDRSDLELDDAAGFHLGAELVLPLGLGIGVSGYTAGSPSDFDASSGFVALAEANYFLNLPVLPVTPYAGLHTGLGTFYLDDQDDFQQRPEVDFGDLGYQVGVRFQPVSLIGVDVQFRSVSGSLEGQQDAEFDTRQLLVGLTLF